MRYMPTFIIPTPKQLIELEHRYHPQKLPTYQRWQSERLTALSEVKLADYSTQAAIWGRTDLKSFRTTYDPETFQPAEVKITKPMRDQWSGGHHDGLNYNVVRAITSNPFAPTITRIFYETGCVPDFNPGHMQPMYYRYDAHAHQAPKALNGLSRVAGRLLAQAGIPEHIIDQPAILTYSTLESAPTMRVERPDGWLVSDAYANWRESRKRDQSNHFDTPTSEKQQRFYSEPHFVVSITYKGTTYRQEVPWGQLPLMKSFEWECIHNGESAAHFFWNNVVSRLHDYVAPMSLREFFAIYFQNRKDTKHSIYGATSLATRLPTGAKAMPRDYNTTLSNSPAQQRQIVDKHYIPESMLGDAQIMALLSPEPVDYVKGKTVGKIVDVFHD